MRQTVLLPTAGLVLAALVGTACERPSSETAPATAMPAVTTPVGPIPGPQNAPLQLAENPYENDDAARHTGQRLFGWYNCAGCHGEHGGGGMGPSLRDSAWLYGSSPARIFASIAEGRAHGMPAWGTRLPSEQIWQLVSYITSLRTSDEPHPPSP